MIIRNLYIYIFTYNPFKNKHFNIYFSFYSFFVILLSLGFIFFSDESQKNIHLLFLIPIIVQFLMSFLYFLKHKCKFMFITLIVNLIHITIIFFVSFNNLKYSIKFYADDLIFELLFSQIFNEIIIFTLFIAFYYKKNNFIVKQISLFIIPVILYVISFILINNISLYNQLWQVKKIYLIIEIILFIPLCTISIFIIPLAIINIFNPVLIFILSSITKEELLLNDKNKAKK